MTGLAHGMALDQVARAAPALSEAELAPVLAFYPTLGAVERIEWHSPRPFAASAIVQTAAATIFVKCHDSRVRSVADLHEEHAFVAHLRARGAAVPAVLAAANDASAIAGPAGTYELHAMGDGEDIYRDAHSWIPARSPGDAQAIGHALGTLHRAAAGFAAPARRTRMLVAGDALIRSENLVSAMETRIAEDFPLAHALTGRPWRTDLRRAILSWHAALQPHAPGLTPLWAHGDFHASNLLWKGHTVTAVLDFGLANRASAVFDLATAIERNTIEWLRLPHGSDVGRPELADALLRGYDAARLRPKQEILALPHMLPIVHLDFALSELAYFHAVTGSRHDEAAAYTDFLLGHADWFATMEGQRFKDSLSTITTP